MDLNPARPVNAASEHEVAGIDHDISVVAGLFARVFDLASVAPDDDFFHLGGDSMIADTLIMEIETAFGVHLSMSVLIEAPTPSDLASIVRDARSRRVASSLIVAKASGRGTPLLCVHGQSGESMFPRKISQALKGDHPVYGFRAIGLEADERPLSSVPSMASRYIATVRERVQPTGPYLILGLSGGSLIAYEMAQQLSAAGETIAGMVLIDPPSVVKLAPFLHMSGPRLRKEHMWWTERVAELKAAVAAMRQVNVETRRKVVRELMHAAAARYVPTAFAGPTLFIHSSERKDALLRGYSPLLTNCEFVGIEAGHFKLFTYRLGELARQIGKFVDRVSEAP